MAKKPSKKTKKVTVAKNLEDFLAAPDSVRLSETERIKRVIRKAKLAAEDARLKASKIHSSKLPSIEDLLADLIRVAEDQETNPHWKFKTLSRKRYTLFGNYPIEFIDREFGQFEHAKQVAGLEAKPGERIKRAAIAENSRRMHASRYIDRYVMPYVLTNKRLTEGELDETKVMLSISDTHATYLDPFTWYCFLSAIRDLKPDIICFNGDILDGSEISRYPKIPGATIPLQLEFDFAREMFRQARELAPDADIIWNAGNHGLDRLASYLTQVAPGFASLRSLRIDELADLGGLNIQLAQGGTLASPIGQEDDMPGILLYGFYRVHHGTFLGDNPAMKELKAANRSGQSGHVHRASLAFGTSEGDRTKSWQSTPMGCSHRAGKAYMKGVTTGWQRGFGYAVLMPDNKVHQYPVVTEDGKCFIEGYYYKTNSAIPDGDPLKLWINDFKL